MAFTLDSITADEWTRRHTLAASAQDMSHVLLHGVPHDEGDIAYAIAALVSPELKGIYSFRMWHEPADDAKGLPRSAMQLEILVNETTATVSGFDAYGARILRYREKVILSDFPADFPAEVLVAYNLASASQIAGIWFQGVPGKSQAAPDGKRQIVGKTGAPDAPPQQDYLSRLPEDKRTAIVRSGAFAQIFGLAPADAQKLLQPLLTGYGARKTAPLKDVIQLAEKNGLLVPGAAASDDLLSQLIFAATLPNSGQGDGRAAVLSVGYELRHPDAAVDTKRAADLLGIKEIGVKQAVTKGIMLNTLDRVLEYAVTSVRNSRTIATDDKPSALEAKVARIREHDIGLGGTPADGSPAAPPPPTVGLPTGAAAQLSLALPMPLPMPASPTTPVLPATAALNMPVSPTRPNSTPTPPATATPPARQIAAAPTRLPAPPASPPNEDVRYGEFFSLYAVAYGQAVRREGLFKGMDNVLVHNPLDPTYLSALEPEKKPLSKSLFHPGTFDFGEITTAMPKGAYLRVIIKKFDDGQTRKLNLIITDPPASVFGIPKDDAVYLGFDVTDTLKDSTVQRLKELSRGIETRLGVLDYVYRRIPTATPPLEMLAYLLSEETKSVYPISAKDKTEEHWKLSLDALAIMGVANRTVDSEIITYQLSADFLRARGYTDEPAPAMPNGAGSTAGRAPASATQQTDPTGDGSLTLKLPEGVRYSSAVALLQHLGRNTLDDTGIAQFARSANMPEPEAFDTLEVFVQLGVVTKNEDEGFAQYKRTKPLDKIVLS